MIEHTVVFYRKDGCHLCEKMEQELHRFIIERRNIYRIVVEERDIEDDPSWFAHFREYVPVLVIDGEEVCHYFMDHQEMDTALSKSINNDE